MAGYADVIPSLILSRRVTLASSCSSLLARNQAFDVVLVDTAGRMQDNTPLMTALAKLIAVNMPDLVLFVGEALVGNEAVDQLVRPCGSWGNFTPEPLRTEFVSSDSPISME